jgi:hypothetical protein
MPSLRFAAIAGTMLLFAVAAPAHAALTDNALAGNAVTQNAVTQNALAGNAVTQNAVTQNALSTNAVTQNALVATGSAIADLNGVAVEGVTLPQATRP